MFAGYLKAPRPCVEAGCGCRLQRVRAATLLRRPARCPAAFALRFEPVGADDGEDAYCQGEAHAQVDAVEHGLLRAAAAGEALADVGGAHEEGCADGAGDGVDGGDDGGAVRVIAG